MPDMVKARAAAWVNLLRLAKARPRTPIELRYCGLDRFGNGLWQVTQGKRYIALQGMEGPVTESILNEQVS